MRKSQLEDDAQTEASELKKIDQDLGEGVGTLRKKIADTEPIHKEALKKEHTKQEEIS